MVVVETRWWSSTTCVLLGSARKDIWLADDTFVRLLHQTNHIGLTHICSFYYVNWDDPIYDQFDDYMEKLEQEEEKAKHDQRSKGTVRLNYKVGKHLGVFIWDFSFLQRFRGDRPNNPHMDLKLRILPPSMNFCK